LTPEIVFQRLILYHVVSISSLLPNTFVAASECSSIPIKVSFIWFWLHFGVFFFTWMSGCSMVLVLSMNANQYIWFLLVVVTICVCFFKFLLNWFSWMLLEMWLKVAFFVGGNLTLKIVLFYIVVVEIVFEIILCWSMIMLVL